MGLIPDYPFSEHALLCPETTLLRGFRVLIAADEAGVRDGLSEALTSAGAVCALASTGTQALRIFMELRPDIVISDVWMSDANGLDLIRRIRALRPEHGGLVPAIAISRDANAEQALMAGYQLFIAKPFDPAVAVGLLAEFAQAESDVPRNESTWTVASPSPGLVVMTFAGYVRAAEVRAAVAVLLRHLEERSCEITVDLRRLTGFSVAGATVAQRAVWARRGSIQHVRFVGGPLPGRIAASATCRLLGIGCTVERQGSEF